MGTSYSIKFVPENDTLDEHTLNTDIERILADINQSMSTYIENSELSRFNQTKNSEWHTLSKDLYHVIEHAHHISSISNGAFDITVGPLVDIWGFGPEPFTQEVPADTTIQTVKQHIGYENLYFDKATTRLAKTIPELEIDLSAIAKGFAVDKIAELLDQSGLNNYLVEIGGELIAKGHNAKQQAWQIGIEQANPLERSVQRIVSLKNIAMATSGDYRNYYEKDGIRYSHTIDPTTGRPIRHTLAAVTVLHHSAMHADALATAFLVLGPEKSLALANKLSIAIYMLVKDGDGFKEQYNDYFKPYLNN